MSEHENLPETVSPACPQCGGRLNPDAPLQPCAACLMRLGLASWQSSRGDAASASASRSGASSAPTVESLAGKLPNYEILDLLGHGGMGAVYKAHQTSLDRLVAIKLIRPDIADLAGFSERFTREARALAKLNHPNIVTVHDFGKTSDDLPMYYLVMEYVEGTDLRGLIELGELTSEQSLKIVPAICEALQFAHDAGIVHRDIKPENILIDASGRVKIADFGLARLVEGETTDPTLTGTRQVMGTIRYMAPEQMEASHRVDHRADIFSLGVVFYEMLTGQVPAGHFEPPSKKVAVDVRLDEVVLRSMAREPERRYQQAVDVKTDVQSVAQAPIAPAPVVPQTSDASRSTTNRETDTEQEGHSHGLKPAEVFAFESVILAAIFGLIGFSMAAEQSSNPTTALIYAWMVIAGFASFYDGKPAYRSAVACAVLGAIATAVLLGYAVVLGNAETMFVISMCCAGMVGGAMVGSFFRFGEESEEEEAEDEDETVQETSGEDDASSRANSVIATDGDETADSAWTTWLRQRPSWQINLTRTLFAVVFFACLLCYVSFDFSGNLQTNDDGVEYRHTVVSVGQPDPWFQYEAFPEWETPFRWKIRYLSWSMLLMLLGFLAMCLSWSIKQARHTGPSTQLGWWDSPQMIVLLWIVVSLIGVSAAMYQPTSSSTPGVNESHDTMQESTTPVSMEKRNVQAPCQLHDA